MIKTAGGIWIPEEPAPKREPNVGPFLMLDPSYLQRYYADHCCCPKCWAKDSCETTTVGCLGSRDTNRASCGCGWVGTVDDLISEHGYNVEIEHIPTGEKRITHMPLVWNDDHFWWTEGNMGCDCNLGPAFHDKEHDFEAEGDEREFPCHLEHYRAVRAIFRDGTDLPIVNPYRD